MLVTNVAVMHPRYFRYHFLEAAALSQIATRYTTAIHAACVELSGTGVLLCGDSGAGKSSLSYACARAGWTYISDDGSYLVHERDDRLVVGNCNQIRFRPTATQLFPELEGYPLTPRAAGKPSVEVPTSLLRSVKRAPTSNIDHIVLLNRNERSKPELVSLSKDVARQYIYSSTFGSYPMRSVQRASIEQLLGAEVLALRYSEVESAVSKLNTLAG